MPIKLLIKVVADFNEKQLVWSRISDCIHIEPIIQVPLIIIVIIIITIIIVIMIIIEFVVSDQDYHHRYAPGDQS